MIVLEPREGYCECGWWLLDLIPKNHNRPHRAAHTRWHKQWARGVPLSAAARDHLYLLGLPRIVRVQQDASSDALRRMAHRLSLLAGKEGGWPSLFSAYRGDKPHPTAYVLIDTEASGNAVAYAVVNGEQGRAGLSDIWVASDSRRKGLGRELCTAVFAHEQTRPAFFPPFTPDGLAFALAMWNEKGESR